MAFYPYYPQPLNPYPQTPVQPYQDRLAQLQNNYQQTIPYGQAQMQQPVQQMSQVAMLPGQMVDGIDTVKAKDVDMTGLHVPISMRASLLTISKMVSEVFSRASVTAHMLSTIPCRAVSTV